MYFIPWKLLNFIIHLLYIISLLQDYNGSQLWDTSFVVQAIISTNLGEEYGVDHGWPISGCTVEGLKVTTQLTQNTCYTDIFIVCFSCAGCSIII